LSFTRAAEELNLSQSAVSKQVAQLETLLERPLFLRVRKRLQLTPEGTLYLIESRNLLSQAEISTRKMRSFSRDREELRVSTLPTFGSRWLISHLNGFRFKHPRIDLHISNRVGMFDFADGDIDVAFFFGHGSWPKAECIYLMGEIVVPVCSPRILSGVKIDQPLALTQLVLLHTAPRPEAWHDWFDAQGCQTHYSYHGPRFETFAMALEAARVGCGVALAPKFLAAEELRKEELIIPWDYPQPSQGAYYLAYPEHKGSLARVRAFVDWIESHLSSPATAGSAKSLE
jgi:DNA-binding transcriptional LysR family regulator